MSTNRRPVPAVRYCLLVLIDLAFVLASPTAAQRPDSPHETDVAHLPPDNTTHQGLALSGHELRFTATAGSIRLRDSKDAPLTDVGTLPTRPRARMPQPGLSPSCSTAVRAWPPHGCRWGQSGHGDFSLTRQQTVRRRHPLRSQIPTRGWTSPTLCSSIRLERVIPVSLQWIPRRAGVCGLSVVT